MPTISAGVWEEDDPDEIFHSAAARTGDGLDLMTGNAEISELAVGKAVQLGNRRAISAPVTKILDQVHFYSRSLQLVAPDRGAIKLDRLPGHEGNVAAADAEVIQFAIGQAVQLRHRLTIAAPVAIVADQVHGSSLSVFRSSLFVRDVDRPALSGIKATSVHSSNAIVQCTINEF